MSSLVGCGDAQEGQRVWGIAAGQTRRSPLALGKEPNTQPTAGLKRMRRSTDAGGGGARGRRAQLLAAAVARHREALQLRPQTTTSPWAPELRLSWFLLSQASLR